MQELLAQAKDAHQQGDSETALTLAQQVLAANLNMQKLIK